MNRDNVDTPTRFWSIPLDMIIPKKVGIVNFPPRVGETKEFSYSLDKIKKGLKYKPKWNIQQGIEQIIKFSII